MQVIVHGGAGGVPDEPEPRQSVLDDAAADATRANTPLEAVEAAVRPLETSPRFNAGTGGARQSDGVVRTDAGVMTSDRMAGAVCSTPRLEHAVSAARVVATETPHVLVAGEHAVALAEDFGIATKSDLLTDRSRDRWADVSPPDGGPREHLAWLRNRFGGASEEGNGDGGPTGCLSVSDHDHDTVGAVASDGERFAAATSTGGRWLALAGRVGDVPQIGAGFYASSAGAASATGAGEDIAKVTLSRRAVRHLERGADATSAAERAITEFEDLTDSTAGLIVIGPGGTGEAYNSAGMQTAIDGD
ncbi:MAG: isoaspartyl peptidase/L-asparaginase [Halobacteriaceae archaeon]